MESRMEKYQEVDIENFQRSKRNANLYKEVYGNYGEFEDLPIPENTNEIDIENLRSLVGSRSFEKKELIENQNIDFEDDSINDLKEEKVHDINALLEIAKEENAKIKKEVPVNKNIPNYLANLESDKNTKDIIMKYDGDNDDDMPIVKEIKYSTTEINFNEKSVNTSSLSLDILSDLKPTGNTLVSEPIKEEINNLEIDGKDDDNFFDDKLKFYKDDFDDDDDNDDDLFYEEKNYTFLKVILIVIGLSTIFTALYFVLKEYTNLF